MALIARLLTVPGADPREIDAHAAGVDLSKVYGLAIAALDTQVSLVQQKTVALSDGIARLTQNLIEHLERLQIKMARQDEAHARELACVHQRLDAVVMMMGMMATTLKERGALPKDFMGRMAQVMREGMAHSAAEPDLLGLHPQADF
ncbi:MAG: hypothetical protein NTV32_05525 [Gammaproteobacteria bacterium]|nr:hypothetical protein [Gammaproteobacteria bacterium]